MKKILLHSYFIAAFCLTILAFLYHYSKDRINSQKNNAYQSQLGSLLTAVKYNNNILNSTIIISDPKCLDYLEQKNPTEAYLAKYNEEVQAVILNTTAPDGYNGNINLLIAIQATPNKKKSTADFRILDIKILHHQETPGLGDLIEPEKSNWLSQFKNKVLSINPWKVTKSSATLDSDPTTIDSISGATITSQAVTKAIYNSLLLLEKHPTLCQN